MVHMLLIAVVALVPSTGSRVCGFSSCWRHTGLAAPRHVDSSQTRDQTCVPCMSRRILNHGTTLGPRSWEVPHFIFVSLNLDLSNNQHLYLIWGYGGKTVIRLTARLTIDWEI